MLDSYPEHPVTYRQEVVDPLFKLLRAGESCVVIGAASVAKSNLVRFLLRSDVQQHYLGAYGQRLLMVLVDTNDLAELSELASYELMLHRLVMESESLAEDDRIVQLLSKLHREVILDKDRLLAQRYVERSLRVLCSERGLHLVLLIDEADRFYRSMDPHFLDSLRAWRDHYKYRLCYVLFTRAPLDRLREPTECEAFYELFNRNTLGLKPYQSTDALRVVSQLEARKEHKLTESECQLLVRVSGGHPGLLVAAFDALVQQENHEGVNLPDWFWAIDTVQAECEKLWDSLDDDEQWALVRIEAGFMDQEPTRAQELLALKGLIVRDGTEHWQVFSPLLGLFIQHAGKQYICDFRVDEQTASVWVAGKQITGLTPLEFTLVKLLYEHPGQVQTRDAILKKLYPHEFREDRVPDIQDNRVDTVVRRLRTKIEPIPSSPRYILTVRGHGYKLASHSDSEQS